MLSIRPTRGETSLLQLEQQKKPEKCFSYFTTYPVVRGHHILGTIHDLPDPTALIPQADGHPLPSHMTVPLPDGTSAPIPTLPPTLGCAFRLAFRFLPVLIFRNSGHSAEFPEFRGTHAGIKSFQGKIYLIRNSGLRNSGRNSGGILCHV